MNYYELLFTTVTTEDYQQDLLIAALGEIGFDTFEELDLGFKAYIPVDNFDQQVLDETLEPYREMFTFSYEVTLIPQKNWNEVWESNFEPIQIGDQVFVRATFHEAKPEFPYEIVIDPKMAFGTGHHQTTAMMMQMMLENDFDGKKVLDMGCGTGILAILAAKLGATDLTAIDYDPVCYESTIENAPLNQVDNIKALCGSKEVIPAEQYDIILANINRNILLDQMESYAKVLTPGGEIYFSGFYESPDLDIITEEARKYNLKYITHKKDKEWVAAKFVV
ncbi:MULTISPECIES: 50S ribosomal protein L11 methyltransferase [unclassified Mucilaginibacter]|uniref:50S ribosomal protein L11 methyltransferase n=1 Tax=unclassified Mucilaginibacter TaxID=2617802 RepID=UPI000966840A|nr:MULTISPECIES: 50S ribosomal protein L11 methyltransferase [unclassified Mucilaginibacter]OJW15968.1 MAG: ribosomal protein L11 methyltransferase [Mucilaginibacter sp. 44-25]PLW89178.1 MAG: 50S ribosomal protein L11 methyltransferase [Mucilaginibacter sp.]PMP64981.1 MAG: 50S ribosomal protein L11 methyltransferase [Mucilaginibacter sp.]HEK19914.1 50S ribosomal protein L11 methyltransferase [Bacteroidota bacterium]